MVEVLKHAPANLGPSERMVLVAIAEDARDATRESWALTRADLCQRTGMSAEALKKAFQRLAKAGLEVRIPLKTDKKGNPVYAYEGKQSTYRLPPLKSGEQSPASEGGTESRLADQAEDSDSRPSETEAGTGSPLSAEEEGTQAPLFDPEGGTESPEGGTGSPPTPHNPSTTSPSEKTQGGAGGRASRRKPETPAPEIFPVTADMRAWAHNHKRTITVDLEDQTERFLNNARQNDRRCRDWVAAWRNWILKAQDFADRDRQRAATGTDGAHPFRGGANGSVNNADWSNGFTRGGRGR